MISIVISWCPKETTTEDWNCTWRYRLAYILSLWSRAILLQAITLQRVCHRNGMAVRWPWCWFESHCNGNTINLINNVEWCCCWFYLTNFGCVQKISGLNVHGGENWTYEIHLVSSIWLRSNRISEWEIFESSRFHVCINKIHRWRRR